MMRYFQNYLFCKMQRHACIIWYRTNKAFYLISVSAQLKWMLSILYRYIVNVVNTWKISNPNLMHISNRIQQVSFLCSYLERFQQSAALPISHSKQIDGIIFLRCICILLYIEMDKKLGLIMPIRCINEIIFHFW